MKEQIKALVKTAYSKFGLKEASLEKLVNIIEQKVNAMGTLEPDKLTEAINSEITAYEPFVGIIQSEVDSRVVKPTPAPKPAPTPTPQDPPKPAEPDGATSELEKRLKELEARLELADKQKTLDQIKKQALDIAKTKGADNEKLLSKVMRLVDIEDGHTAEQVAEKLVSEYSELYTTTTEGAVPAAPTQSKMSEADLAKAREEAIKKSKDSLLKDKTY